MSQRSLKWQMVIGACWFVLGLAWIFSGIFRDASPWAFLVAGVFVLVAAWNAVQVRKQLAAAGAPRDGRHASLDQPSAPLDQP
jgi:hypothetical protein